MTTNGNNKQADTVKKHYFNVAQLRSDLWAELKLQSYRLARYKEPKKIEAHKTTAQKAVKTLRALEQYWAFPGLELLDFLQALLKKGDYVNLKSHVVEINRTLVNQDYRYDPVTSTSINQVTRRSKLIDAEGFKKRYFEVLFVDNQTVTESLTIKSKLRELRDDNDHFIYKIVLAQSFEDALVSLQLNPNIQACIVRYGIPFKSKNLLGVLRQFVSKVSQWGNEDYTGSELAILLGKVIGEIRPELDTYYVTDTAVQDISDSVLQNFRRIFYRTEDLQELHLSIIQGIKERYETPFYTALQEYSQKPTGVFHAMPVSRGNSVF
jgi:arginine decarboxylase